MRHTQKSHPKPQLPTTHKITTKDTYSS